MSIYEQKWQKFLSRIWLFRFIPFVDFVLAAGSLATGASPHQTGISANGANKNQSPLWCGGEIREDSDFDVIVGCRQDRIFTARLCCWLLFGLFGWRAKHLIKSLNQINFQYFTLLKVKKIGKREDEVGKVKNLWQDKFCFSHFVTPNSYRLSPPYNAYWQKLYQSLVSVYGNPKMIQKFFDANKDWTGPVRNSPPKGSFGPRLRAGAVSNGMVWFLSGKFGDLVEKILKKIQIKKIEESLKQTETYKPRIIFNDNELEFHPHTKRIEDFIKNL